MIELNVIGVPAPQGSKTAWGYTGKDGRAHATMTEGGSKTGREKHKSWRAAVATAARDYVALHQSQPALGGAVAVTIHFRFSPVASDRFRTRHTTKPDIDKLARSVLDSLVDGGILTGDSTVWSLKVDKMYADNEPPGCRVLVWDQSVDEAQDREAKKGIAKLARKK